MERRGSGIGRGKLRDGGSELVEQRRGQSARNTNRYGGNSRRAKTRGSTRPIEGVRMELCAEVKLANAWERQSRIALLHLLEQFLNRRAGDFPLKLSAEVAHQTDMFD